MTIFQIYNNSYKRNFKQLNLKTVMILHGSSDMCKVYRVNFYRIASLIWISISILLQMFGRSFFISEHNSLQA